MPPSTMTRRRFSSFSDPMARTSSNPAIRREDKDLRAEFARSAHEKLQFEEDRLAPDRVTFTVGEQEWPFPVPVIRKDGKWHLDSASGRLEILARRIGRNELNAMEVCRGYAEAQLEYAAGARDGDRVLKYAQKIAATPGKQDGLYADGVPDSLVSQAFAAAAAANPSTGGKQPEPYHGYYFRVLKSQGPDAAGGAFDYVVNGKMIGGFALVAWPAEYGVSGIRTLLINHEGVVYEKDLGAGTAIASPPDDALQSRQILAAGGPRVARPANHRRLCLCQDLPAERFAWPPAPAGFQPPLTLRWCGPSRNRCAMGRCWFVTSSCRWTHTCAAA